MKAGVKRDGAAERAYDLYLRDLRRLPGAQTRAASPTPRSTAGLVESHLFYVVRLAREYTFTRIPVEDLLSEGNLGLMEAAARYDPARGTKFITYASWWIRKRILNLIARQMTLVRLPKYALLRLRRIRQAERDLTASLGRAPTEDEVAVAAGLSPAEVVTLRLAGQGPISLESVVREDGARLEERLAPDEETADAEETAVVSDLAVQVRRLMGALPDNERFVVRHRFGFHGGPPETLERIARRMDLSRERVRQIERSALERIRRAFAREANPRSSSPCETAFAAQHRSAI